MSGETLSYCPLSKARAAFVSAHTHDSMASDPLLRMRSSTARFLFRIACQFADARESKLVRLGLSREAVARLKIERSAPRRIDAMQNSKHELHEWRRFVLVATAAAAVRFSTPSLA